MPSVGVAIMAHPKRDLLVRSLVNRIKDKRLVIVWDTTDSPYDTGRRAWLEGKGSGVTHWAVIQDDAIVCQDFVPSIEAALQYINPFSPLSLYLGTSRPYAQHFDELTTQADNQSASFIVTNRICWGVGLVVPVVQIPSMIDFCDRRVDKMYDRRLSTFFLNMGVRVWHTWPSLVDHRNSVPSILNHRAAGRRARRFVGKNASGLSVDWSGGVVEALITESRRKP